MCGSGILRARRLIPRDGTPQEWAGGYGFRQGGDRSCPCLGQTHSLSRTALAAHPDPAAAAGRAMLCRALLLFLAPGLLAAAPVLLLLLLQCRNEALGVLWPRAPIRCPQLL